MAGVALVPLFLNVGCMPEPAARSPERRVAIARAATDLACPAGALTTDVVGQSSDGENASYRIRGCGREVYYTCMATDSMQWTCIREPPPPAP